MPLRMSSMSLYSSSGTLNIVPRMDGLGTSFLLRFIFLESEIYIFTLSAKRVRLRGWCSHGVRGNLVEIIILLRMSKTCLLHSGSGRQHRVGYWNSFLCPVCHILRFFWIVFANILMELFVVIIFLYGLLPVFAISEGGDKDQSLKSTLTSEAKVSATSILDDDATSMSAKHSTYRRLILFDVRPRVLRHNGGFECFWASSSSSSLCFYEKQQFMLLKQQNHFF